MSVETIVDIGPDIASAASPCLHQLFKTQCDLTPDAPALACGLDTVSYAELDSLANRAALHLIKLGIGPETRVALLLDRSIRQIIMIIAVLKTGAAYLPIEPFYPRDRIVYMLEDSQASLVVTEKAFIELTPAADINVVLVENLVATGAFTEVETVLNLHSFSGSPAYIMYTSGSTGKPKGVIVTHRNISRLFDNTRAWFGFSKEDVWCQFHSYAFDFSVWEIWGALLHGSRLVIVPNELVHNPEAFYGMVDRERVTILNQTPSAFRNFAQAEEHYSIGRLPSLRIIIFGGEQLDSTVLRPWIERHGDSRPQLINMYGLTETAVHVTFYRVLARDVTQGGGCQIGIPIPDMQVHLLNRNYMPSLAQAAEMYVGGAGVAGGYLGRPALTAERFLPDPFTNETGARMYRSGDLGRLQGPNLEYLGRIDNQVKIRGYRIELGEIESELQRYPGVRRAAVVVRQDDCDEKYLTAFLVAPIDRIDVSDLRRALAARLPSYMVPSNFAVVDELPLTSNGKVDRQMLINLQVRPVANNPGRTGPMSPVEQTIARIWAEVLQQPEVGVEDNFFDVGGHSLLLLRVLGSLERDFPDRVTMLDLFEYPTIASLARFIELDPRDTASLQDQRFEQHQSGAGDRRRAAVARARSVASDITETDVV